MYKKHHTTAIVCRYVLEMKQVSNRAIARLLGIHHTTWLRYMSGYTHPGPGVKYKLVRLMRARDFNELVHLAFNHCIRGV